MTWRGLGASVLVRPLAVGLVVGLLCVSGSAFGQANKKSEALIAQAEVLIARGVALRTAGDDQAALKFFVDAYDIVATPRTATQRGLCEFALNRWVEAEAHLSEALRAPSDPFIRKHRATLDRSIATVKSHLGRVEITGRPAGAEVEVDGRPAGLLPLGGAVRVAAGTVHVRVAARGHETLRQTVTVKPNELARLTVDLEETAKAVPAQAASSPVVDVSPMVGPAVPATPPPDPAVDPPRESRGWQRPLAWISTGLAVAAVGAGSVAMVVHVQNGNRFNDVRDAPLTLDKRCYEQAPERGGGRCEGLYDNSRQARTWAIAAFVTGGLAAAVAITLFATSGKGEDGARAQVTCTPSVGGGGSGRDHGVAGAMFCAGRF